MTEIPEDVMKAAREAADAIVDSMALTYRHDYGLLIGEERARARVVFEQIAYHDVRPAIARALMAERAAERERAYSDCLDVIQHAEEHYKGAVMLKIKRAINVKLAALRGGTNE